MERQALIAEIARRLERRHLAAPAVLLLESHKPFGFVVSQAMLLLEPLVEWFLGPTSWREYAAVLEDPQGIELLLEELES